MDKEEPDRQIRADCKHTPYAYVVVCPECEDIARETPDALGLAITALSAANKRIEQLEAVLREIFRATSDENELLPLHYKQVQDIASKALAAEKKDEGRTQSGAEDTHADTGQDDFGVPDEPEHIRKWFDGDPADRGRDDE